jgi:DNA-binding Lrp family transcriptional regulator
MDQLDARLLTLLQRDSSPTMAELAARVGLSQSACHRRVRMLEADGFISGYVAKLDRSALRLTIEVFVDITLASQSEESLEAFERAVDRYDEILECWLTSGDHDYHLRVAARDMQDFDRIHRNCLARLPGVSAMRSTFALRSIKPWSGYPVRPESRPVNKVDFQYKLCCPAAKAAYDRHRQNSKVGAGRCSWVTRRSTWRASSSPSPCRRTSSFRPSRSGWRAIWRC